MGHVIFPIFLDAGTVNVRFPTGTFTVPDNNTQNHMTVPDNSC